MWADTQEELHEMAQAIGMKRAWYQDHTIVPHYDLVPTRRRKAIELGAVEYPLRKWMEEHRGFVEERIELRKAKKKRPGNS
jgi:hypothetical protein